MDRSIAPPWRSRPVDSQLSERVLQMGVIADAINRHTLSLIAEPGHEFSNFALAKSKALCVLTTMVGLDVFPQLQFSDVKPMTLEVYAATREDFEANERGEPMVLGPLHMGPPLSGVGTGHVGLMVEGAIVDPVAGQATRISSKTKLLENPETPVGILVPDSIVISKAMQPKDIATDCAQIACNGGETVLQYRTRPDYHGYLQSDIWRNPISIHAKDLIVQKIMAELSPPQSQPSQFTRQWQESWSISDVRASAGLPSR